MGDGILAKALLPVVQAFVKSVPVDTVIDVDEGVRGVGQCAELYWLPVFSAPRIIDGARCEESLAVEARRAVAVQPLGKRLWVASQDIDDVRTGIFHIFKSSTRSGLRSWLSVLPQFERDFKFLTPL